MYLTTPQQNDLTRDVRSVHLIAICGTGMGALAVLLKESGYDVTGSDLHVYPPMSTFLEGKGIRIMEGFSAERLSSAPDLVVVGNAVSRENPEVCRMLELGIPYLSFPQALNAFFLKGKDLLVVTGTHGKTTTTS
ncbi:MAG: Mur ligase domain-containing protein, partial [archaeon]